MINLEISKSSLLEGLNTVSKGLGKKDSALPILGGIKFNVEADTVTLTTTDVELRITTKVNGEGMLNEGGDFIVLDGKLFIEIIRKLPDGIIKIKQEDEDEKFIVIKVNRSKFKVAIELEVGNFPEAPLVKEQHKINIGGNELKRILNETLICVAQEETRPILTGILLENKNSQLNIVALDGYRLSYTCNNTGNDNDFSAVIPGKNLSEISKILSDKEITIGFSENHCIFKMGDTEVMSRLMSGEYPKYSSILPQEASIEVNINREKLLNAVERASLLSKGDKSSLIKLNFAENNLNITSNSTIGVVSEDVECEIEGADLTIAFNAKYIIDALKAIGDEIVKMLLNSSVSPALIVPQSNISKFLVLPVRIAE